MSDGVQVEEEKLGNQRYSPIPAGYKWVALSVTTVGVLMVAIDASIVILALPPILRDLHAGLAVATWVVNGYSLVLTVFLIPFGRLCDMHGRTRLYIFGFAAFTLGSAVAAFAYSGLGLVLGRLIQGFGGTLILANSQPILFDAFPVHERGRGFGIQTVAFAVGSISGFVLGGLLIPFGGWRTIFLINLPIGVFAVFWAQRRLIELARIRPNQRHDVLGIAILGSSLTSLLISASLGPEIGWLAPATIVTGASGSLLLTLLYYIERKAKDPLLDPRLLSIRPFALGNAASFLNSLAFAGLPFILTFYLQGFRGESPEAAAIVLIPFITAASAFGPFSGYIADRWGARLPATSGLLVMSLGLYAFAFLPLPAADTAIMGLLTLCGVGAGFFFAPNNTAVLSSVPASYLGVASATRSTLFNLGRVTAVAFASIALALSLGTQTLAALLSGANISGGSLAMQEFASGFHTIFFAFGTINLLAAFVSVLRGSQPSLGSTSMDRSPQSSPHGLA